ncbi:MAG: hypothetical protein ACRDCE_19900, partial [Cetobacterium sp.]|uniref:hypothetical protein n=1 Tax=Cetobacterium sp. TaxID=2071632 RepID=UPI003EE61C2B
MRNVSTASELIGEFLDSHPYAYTPAVPIKSQIIFKDGSRMSVQASEGHYCIPRDNLSSYKDYTHYEVCASFLDDLLVPYADGSVCPRVPAEVVLEVINKRGGFP